MPTRGDTTARGYGRAHQLERERWHPIIDDGAGYCTEPVCLYQSRWIPPSAEWDLAHDRATGEWRGPAHARCNRSEGARYRNTGRQDPPSQPVHPTGW